MAKLIFQTVSVNNFEISLDKWQSDVKIQPKDSQALEHKKIKRLPVNGWQLSFGDLINLGPNFV